MKIEALRLAPFAVAACAGALAMSGCGENLSGKGNEFVIEGEVVKAGHNSVRLGHITVIDAQGKAEGWFDDGKTHKIHDNYRTCNFWGNLDWHVVGDEAAIEGRAETLQDVKTGESVRLTGKIRDSYNDCGDDEETETRPVFDQLREVVPAKYRK
jgi:hypothetical protein